MGIEPVTLKSNLSISKYENFRKFWINYIYFLKLKTNLSLQGDEYQNSWSPGEEIQPQYPEKV